MVKIRLSMLFAVIGCYFHLYIDGGACYDVFESVPDLLQVLHFVHLGQHAVDAHVGEAPEEVLAISVRNGNGRRPPTISKMVFEALLMPKIMPLPEPSVP
jgi:hypothetical protein